MSNTPNPFANNRTNTPTTALIKGQSVRLNGEVFDLSQVRIGINWQTTEGKVGFLNRFLRPQKAPYDLDLLTLLLDTRGKMQDTQSDLIFYNNQHHPDWHLWMAGDHRDGNVENDAAQQDDEEVFIKLTQIDMKYQKIVFIVQIHDGNERKQNFGQLKQAYLTLSDAQHREIARYDLADDLQKNGSKSAYEEIFEATAIRLAALQRTSTGWFLQALGQPFQAHDLQDILRGYTA